MNWANRLTLSRLALTVLFVGLLSSSWHYARTAALVIFLIAGLTDFVDGEIARRYGDITNFGKLMDPLVDKIMVARGIHFTRSSESRASMGSNNHCGAGFSDHRSAANGERQGANSASGKSRANKKRRGKSSPSFFSSPSCQLRNYICEWDAHLVVAGVGRSRVPY